MVRILILAALLAAAAPAIAQPIVGPEYRANRGAVGGFAPLDSNSHVPAANIPFGTTAGTVADGGALSAVSNIANAAVSPSVLSNALAAYSTTTAMNQAISNALSTYETTSALTTALSLYATTSSLSNMLQAYTTTANLGGAAFLGVGTAANTVAAGNDSRITGAAQKANNLSDLASPSTARSNLGLGSAATMSVGVAGGVPQLSTLSPGLPRVEGNRAPTSTDDVTTGHTGVSGNYQGDLWTYNGAVWQALQVSPAGQADWAVVSAPRPICTPGALTTAPAVCFGTTKLNLNYSGAALVLTRSKDFTTQSIGFVGTAIDSTTADTFCFGSAHCWITTWYDQSGNGYNATATLGLYGAVPSAAGSGYAVNQTLTLATTGGTCTTPAQVNIGPTNSGALSSTMYVSVPGECTAAPTLPMAVTAVSSGNGTGATITGTWTYPNAPEWIPNNNVNGVRAVSFDGAAATSATQGVADAVLNARFLKIGTGFAWTPSNSTWAINGQHLNSNQARTLVHTLDGAYGIETGIGNVGYMRELGQKSANHNCGVLLENNPSVLITAWNGANVACTNNNQYATASNWDATTESATGAVLGLDFYSSATTAAGGTDDMNVTTFIGFATGALGAADTQNLRIALAEQDSVQMQGNSVVLIAGASQSAGIGNATGNSWATIGQGNYRYPVKMFNIAISGQSMSNEISNFGTNGGDDQWYQPWYSQVIIHNVGYWNDLNGGATAQQTHARIANWIYLWRQKIAAAGKPASQLKIILGTPFAQSPPWNTQPEKQYFEQLVIDLRANWNIPQPTGSNACTTATTCTSGGYGADGFNDTLMDPTVGLPTFLRGSYVATSGNAGNGTVTAISAGASYKLAPSYTATAPGNDYNGVYTVTMSSPTTFTVTDPSGTVLPPGVIGTAYVNAEINFTVNAGGTAFVAGDSISVVLDAGFDNPPPSASTAWSGEGQHPNDAAIRYMWISYKAAVDAALALP